MEKKIESYAVIILKRNDDHIIALETKDFNEADQEWKALKDKWQSSLKEVIPFEMRKPIVTAFDPGLIFEITIKPIYGSSSNENNPYQQEMRKNGFSRTFSSNSSTKGIGDILDSGYKA